MFGGMRQKTVLEMGDGDVGYDFVTNQSIYRVAFCADIDNYFCYITQDVNDVNFKQVAPLP